MKRSMLLGFAVVLMLGTGCTEFVKRAPTLTAGSVPGTEQQPPFLDPPGTPGGGTITGNEDPIRLVTFGINDPIPTGVIRSMNVDGQPFE